MGTLIREFVEIMIIVMPAIALTFIFVLIYVHLAIDIRRFIYRKIKLYLLRFIKAGLYLEKQMQSCNVEFEPRVRERLYSRVRFIKTSYGLRIFEELAQTLQDEKKEFLLRIVNSKSYTKYLRRKLKSLDITSILVIIKIIGELSLPGYGDQIERILYKYSKRVSVQQTCFLALSNLKETKRIIQIIGDKKFVTILSFRTFQEFFDAYQGDRIQLITSLLVVDGDMYVKRACVKSIGSNHIQELAPLVMPFLDSKYADHNIQIDAIRTFGILQYKPSGDTIAKLAVSTKWEVRGMVAWSLANIDMNRYFDVIMNLLFDARWGVRYRAAQALANYQDSETVVDLIKEKKDKYALDIFLYMLQQKILFKGEVVE